MKKKPHTSHGPTLITSVFFPRKKESPCGEAYIQSVKANCVPIPIKTGTSVRQGFDAPCLHPLMIPSRFAVREEGFHYRTGSKWASRITVRDLNPFITGVRSPEAGHERTLDGLTGRKNGFWWFSIHVVGDIFCLRSIYTQIRLNKLLFGGLFTKCTWLVWLSVSKKCLV